MIAAMIALANLLEGGFQPFLDGIPAANLNAVPRDTDLQTYLDEQKMPRWYQNLLFRHSRIDVDIKQANGTLEPLVPAPIVSVPLPQGSTVRIIEDLAGQFGIDVNDAADAAHDFAFRPDPDPDNFLDNTMAFYEQLDSVMFGPGNGVRTLPEFIRGIGLSEIGPPRNLIIITHAHWSGMLHFGESNFSYEHVDAIASELRLDDKYLLKWRAAKNKPPLLMFTGCSVGQAAPFLKKLRDAINPKLAIIAPQHLFGVKKVTDRDAFLVLMFKSYEVFEKTRLNRAELIAKLIKPPKRPDAHGDLVGDREWQTWVLAEPWPQGGEFFYAPEDVPYALWYTPIHGDVTVWTEMNQATFEETPDNFKAAIAALPADPSNWMSTAHPFPLWTRLGLSDANKLVDSLSWTFSFENAVNGRPTKVVATGVGHRYSVLVPIVEQSAAAYPQRRPLMNVYLPDPNRLGYRLVEPPGLPFPKLPLRNHGPSNTKYWNMIEPSA